MLRKLKYQYWLRSRKFDSISIHVQKLLHALIQRRCQVTIYSATSANKYLTVRKNTLMKIDTNSNGCVTSVAYYFVVQKFFFCINFNNDSFFIAMKLFVKVTRFFSIFICFYGCFCVCVILNVKKKCNLVTALETIGQEIAEVHEKK